MKDTVEELKRAVEQLHNCKAGFVEETEVVELFHGKTVWEGRVFVFDLEDHPQAARTYAWSSSIEGSTKRRYCTVLHVPPVDSQKKR